MNNLKKLILPNILLAVFCFAVACSTAPKGLELKSPGGQLSVELSVDDSLQFVLQYMGSDVITLERMGFQFKEYLDLA